MLGMPRGRRYRFYYPGCTLREEDGRCAVLCECGHKSYGTHFGFVYSHKRGDAWVAHKNHMDRKCKDRRGIHA